MVGQYTNWIVTKKCKLIQDRRNYVEKMDHDSSHIQAPENIKKIESYLVNKGLKNFEPLCDWILFLFLTKGIVQANSIFTLELSDFFHVRIKHHVDPHSLTVLIM